MGISRETKIEEKLTCDNGGCPNSTHVEDGKTVDTGWIILRVCTEDNFMFIEKSELSEIARPKLSVLRLKTPSPKVFCSRECLKEFTDEHLETIIIQEIKKPKKLRPLHQQQ